VGYKNDNERRITLEKRGEKLKSEGIGKRAGYRSGIVMWAQRCNADNAHSAIWHCNTGYGITTPIFFC